MGFLDSLPFFRRGQADASTPAEVLMASEPTQAEAPVAAAPAVTAPVVAAPVAAVPAAEPEPEPVPAAPSPADRVEAEKLVKAVAQELPDFVTIAVLEQAGGRILAGQWAGHSGGAVEAAAANAELVRQVHLALDALQLGADEQLEDIVITLQRQLHLMQVLPLRPWLLYLAVRSQDTNLALARTVLRGFAS